LADRVCRNVSGRPLAAVRLAVGIETLVVVTILTWGVMPLLTRWFKSWLMPSQGGNPQKGTTHENRLGCL
jgi:antibiotic biosynthesis monooxygenase (ABM) superfamily enzyme